MAARAAAAEADAGLAAPGAPADLAARRPAGRRAVDRPRTPLFHAQHDARYLRRNLIREYQARYGCRLAVMIDTIDHEGVTYFAELVHDADPDRDLHLLVRSPGGDAETAVRLIRAAQASCRRLVLVVPDVAKSAATVLALGAHEIVMGPTSDLGPIDPQVFVGERGYVSAKEIIAAVEGALADVLDRPSTHPLHAALLGNGGVDATVYEFAKLALGGTTDVARQAIASNPDRSAAEVAALVARVEPSLIAGSRLHSAVVGAAEAREAGLPVVELGLCAYWWRDIWEIWTRYFALGPLDTIMIYESEHASQILDYVPATADP